MGKSHWSVVESSENAGGGEIQWYEQEVALILIEAKN